MVLVALLSTGLLHPRAEGPRITLPPHAQASPAPPDLSVPPIRWAEAAALSEEHIVNYDPHKCLRYRVHRTDAKGSVTRLVIESTDGPVARLLSRDGRPLTADEDSAERERLQAMLSDPDAFFRHQHRDEGSRAYATELLRTMPHSMLWTYAPGQPQLPGASAPAVVLDFKPDPQFKPPSLVTEGLAGIAGRVWVDADSRVVTRIQGTAVHPVDFGWGGFLARIRAGGSVELEQTMAPNGRWLFSHLVEHLSIREVLVHTVDENADVTATEIEVLPNPVTYPIAVQMLLAQPSPAR